MMTPETDGSAATPIRVQINGEWREVPAPQARMTMLDYLRDELRLRGTKEGCAEGDCGACMIALADADGDRFKAVNACQQLLGTLQGQRVVTVEGLGASNPGESSTRLHPAQRAMVEAGASQCGFCTPGFVMSLFALRSTHPLADDDQLLHALAGNLCRCTGYRPILEAARSMLTGPPDLHLPETKFTVAAPATVHAPGFDSPVTLEELHTCLAAAPDAVLMAGGTDLIPGFLRQRSPLPQIIHLGRVPELQLIAAEPDFIDIGAAATLDRVLPLLADEYPGLAELCRRFASLPICNRATLAGNLATGSPVGDLIPVLIALDARIRIGRPGSSRVVSAEGFHTGHRSHCLRTGEYVASVRLPKRIPGQVVRAWKVSRRFEQDTSTVLVCFNLGFESERVVSARVSFGGLSDRPMRAFYVEQALTGRALGAGAVSAARRALHRDHSPISDHRGSAEYRIAVAENLIEKLALDITGQEQVSLWRA